MAESRDLSRLPKWAQIRINQLENSLADARAMLTAGPEDSDTFADPLMRPRPLGSGPLIRFGGTGFDRTFDVQLQGGELHITANTSRADVQMAVQPWVSNAIRVIFMPRTEAAR